VILVDETTVKRVEIKRLLNCPIRGSKT